mmetsp:Transcript_36649/g.88314  ORF Transcript_36649/g.88314 Transcript_36649/m.88314 type:complete len:87 (-) Transcript_36649:61-321(-)
MIEKRIAQRMMVTRHEIIAQLVMPLPRLPSVVDNVDGSISKIVLTYRQRRESNSTRPHHPNQIQSTPHLNRQVALLQPATSCPPND